MIRKMICLSVGLFLASCQAYKNPSLLKLEGTPQYTSTILQDGTSVVIKLPNGEQRTVLADSPSYSATIGMVNVQGQANKLVINATQPTVTAAGQVTGSGLFKPNAPEGAHWQLIALNGKAIDARHSKRPPYVRMSAGKMQGLTGCNVMSGFYRRNSENQSMQFIQVQGTTQTCDYQSLEASFIKALQDLREWRITSDYHLQFLSDKQQLLAEFVALSP